MRTAGAVVGCGALVACAAPLEAELPCGEPGAGLGPAPPGFELLSVDAERSEVASSVMLLTQRRDDDSWAVALDGCAQPIWWRVPEASSDEVFRARLGRDGERVLVAEQSLVHRPDRGWLHEVDPGSGAVLRSTRLTEAHHDFVELDGEVAWISWEYLGNEWFPGLDADVVSDAVRVAPLGRSELTDARWFGLRDDTGLEPWWTCSHMTPGDRVPGYAEWSHSNSLVHDPDTGRSYLNARHWDALVAIEPDGSVPWILGGPDSDLQPVGDTSLPVHAHLSEVWDGGLLAFDNRNHQPERVSRVVELAIDEEAGTVEEVWSHDDGTFGAFLGDARRLPGGNVLIAWSQDGRLTEVTREGDVVWEAAVEEGRLGRVEVHPQWPGR